MSGNLAGFDSEKVERTERSFELLPPNSYKCAIVDAPMKTTNAGNGRYLALKMQVLDGEFQNRFLWDNLNVKNPNETAERIAKERLAEICESVGISKPNDSAELCHKPLVAVVGQNKRKDTGELQNVIRQYKPVDGFEPEPVSDQKAPWV